MYISNCRFAYKQLSPPTPRNKPAISESVWVSVACGDLTLAAASIYRAPYTDGRLFCQQLEHEISAYRNTHDHLLILGDLNAKNSTWYSFDETDSLGNQLQCMLDTYNLSQFTNFPTFIYRGHPKSCLDLVVSSMESHELIVGSTAPLGGADHLIVHGEIAIPVQTHSSPCPSCPRWNWSEQSIQALRETLANSSLTLTPTTSRVSPAVDIQRLWAHWRTTVVNVSKLTCQAPPARPRNSQGTTGPPRPWMTKELKLQIKLKHSLFRRYTKSRSQTTWEEFTQQRNKVTSLLRAAKSSFVTTSEQSVHKPRLHKLISCIKKPPPRPVPGLVTNDQLITSPRRKAMTLNNFFVEQSRRSVEDAGDVPPLPILLPPLHLLSPHCPQQLKR